MRIIRNYESVNCTVLKLARVSDSPYRTAISGSVLKMQESGLLRDMKKKWWSWPPWKSNETSCEVRTLSAPSGYHVLT